MNSLFKLIGASLDAGASIDQRRVLKDTVDGFTISTVWTEDQGYETAIGDTSGRYHPVERYPSKEAAQKGHPIWVAFVQGGNREIVQLGYDDIVEDQKMTLT